MIWKILLIFKRDMKVSVRNFLTLYILVVPVIFAVVINVFSPGINDTTVEIVLLEGENPEQVEFFKQFANIELLDTLDDVEERVKKRDNIVAVLPEKGEEYFILTQGNEPDYVVDYVKNLTAFDHYDIDTEDSLAEIIDYGRDIPPLKKLMVNIAVMFTSILGGMIIALNIVEEKTENTISAIHVSPVSRLGFIAGKSIIGVFVPVVGAFLMLVITGFRDINYLHAFLMITTSCIISILIGFIEGINNDDVMTAAGNMKMLFLPLFGSVAAIELLADKWQPFFYWIPFYWSYKGNNLVLSGSGSFVDIIRYSGIVLGISAVVFVVLAPKIRKGLE
ncbi:ABC-type multidrug transport system, permease component [Dethiosulfatibacter aminovorans DSM 17477]|uniref:ABC-type multidrug transport system, permease component n=1 Tax=Dethiosulfatibacter aminovorans DSM 17477 TaxID=1121476 RepID=A0A1M6JVF0_9FIRM|nr:ABC transporter permease [Dethiosulfatibacter aminovorans]SHJ50677.1 ABC-type multidrug transport system, permease component [Dethiosulfatibacter aminovorans DSM 17477]